MDKFSKKIKILINKPKTEALDIIIEYFFFSEYSKGFNNKNIYI